MTLGQLWSNSITQNDPDASIKPVTTNESVVNQNMEGTDEKASNEKYHNYKKSILDKVINGGKLNNEPETSE